MFLHRLCLSAVLLSTILIIWRIKTTDSTLRSGRPSQSDRFDSSASLNGALPYKKAYAMDALQQNGTPPKIPYHEWLQTLSRNTAEQADDEQHRLLAISSLASATAAEAPLLGRYVAGLWTAHLPNALGWSMISPRRQPLPYTVPSWSWASLGGQVKPVPYPSSKLLKVLNVHVTLADNADPFGEVLDGYIVVEGELGRTGHAVEGDLPGSMFAKGTLAMKLCWSDWNLFYALLLKPSERCEGAYERLGIDIIMDHAFYDAKTTIVKIV